MIFYPPPGEGLSSLWAVRTLEIRGEGKFCWPVTFSYFCLEILFWPNKITGQQDILIPSPEFLPFKLKSFQNDILPCLDLLALNGYRLRFHPSWIFSGSNLSLTLLSPLFVSVFASRTLVRTKIRSARRSFPDGEGLSSLWALRTLEIRGEGIFCWLVTK